MDELHIVTRLRRVAPFKLRQEVTKDTSLLRGHLLLLLDRCVLFRAPGKFNQNPKLPFLQAFNSVVDHTEEVISDEGFTLLESCAVLISVGVEVVERYQVLRKESKKRFKTFEGC